MPTSRFKTLVLGTNLAGTDNGDNTITVDAAGGSGIPASIVDAKGDLIAASANDTVARLPVGSNNQVLVADSAQTLGVKWAAVPGGGYVAVDTIWDAKGDLAVASGADAASRLAVGSNNQVLTADSAQTLGVKWATPASGTTIANDTIWDAKGDIVAASAADTGGRLAVGSDGQVLTADSAQTLGVKWATPGGGGGGAWTLLSTTTLSSPGTLDVSSISGSYNDLILVVIARGSVSSTLETLQLILNNDTSGKCSREIIQVSSTGAVSGTQSIDNAAFNSAGFPGGTATANFFGVAEYTIYGYASTSWDKIVQWDAWGATADTAGSLTMIRGGGLFVSTAAITRVTLQGSSAANLATGSTLRIYGRT